MSAPTVALLGTGKMGAAFIERWRASGRDVVVWNRTADKAAALVGDGVRAEESVALAAASAAYVVTTMTNGEALMSVLIGGGAIEAMAPGTTLIDLSTIDASSSHAIAVAAQRHGVRYVRGAVSGTPAVVRAGAATLLLSGPDDAIESAREVLEEITPTHVIVGEAEESRIVKMAVNSLLGGTMQLLAEATTFAEASGVDRAVFLDALDQSVISSRFVTYQGAALRARDYGATFTTADALKDADLVRRAAEAAGVPLFLGTVVHERLVAAIEAGYARDDFLSLFCVQQLDSAMPADLERIPPP